MSFGDAAEAGPSGPPLDLRWWVWVFFRRIWLFGLVAVLLTGAGLAVAFLLPPVYEARARLLVESQQIPSDLVRSTVNASAIEQIEVIKQRLLTRETLLEIAARHSVFPAGADLRAAERVTAMQDAIRFDQRILGGGGRGETVSTALSISFRSERAVTAAGVVNDLVTRMLRQSVELRQRRASTTAEYFRREVDRLSGDLLAAEARIVAFQEANKGALPDSLAYRRSQLDALQERLAALQLEGLEQAQEQELLRAALGEGGGPAPDQIAEEIEGLNRLLVRRSAILTEDHPEIRMIRRRIETLQRVAEAEAEAAADAADAAGTAAAPPVVESAAARELRRRLAVAEARVGFVETAIETLSAERDDLVASLDETPNVGMELAALQRAWRVLEGRYETALLKLAEAEAGEQLEDRQQGERLEVIEQATVPERPIAPSRLRYAVLGAGAGVAGGFGLIVLLEMLSGAVRRPEDLSRIGREPVAVIPMIATPFERRRTWALRGLLAVAVVGGLSGGLWAVHTFYLPLETVAKEMAERVGLDEAAALVRRRLGL